MTPHVSLILVERSGALNTCGMKWCGGWRASSPTATLIEDLMAKPQVHRAKEMQVQLVKRQRLCISDAEHVHITISFFFKVKRSGPYGAKVWKGGVIENKRLELTWGICTESAEMQQECFALHRPVLLG